MAEIVIMPKLGFNMSKGKLVSWHKQEGDAIQKGQPLFSVETDKAVIDIESVADGYVRKLFIEEGDTLPVTLPIAVIAGKDEDIDALVKEASSQLAGEVLDTVPGSADKTSSTPVVEVKPEKVVAAPVTSSGKVMASPRARRVAQEMNVDLASANISGTGFEGGISEKDVLEYVASAPTQRATPLARKMADAEGMSLDVISGTGVSGKVMKKDVLYSLASGQEVEATEFEVTYDGKEIAEKIPYEGVRKIIGDRLSSSMFSAPHIYFTQKVNLEKLLELRKQVNEVQDKKTSVTDYIARAAILAVQKYPELNSSLVGDVIERYKSVNLGIAVASPTGLIVPVVKNSQNMSVLELSEASSVLVNKAREGKLMPDEFAGGTFTISNLGMFGIDQFTAIINPPESGILAISATKDEPVVVVNEAGVKEVLIKPMMNITLSADHRVADGLVVAQTIMEIKELLEHPMRLFL
jgi:pyruvate dehydrogenase E2 component (dihydrolipoamide acetyltransferase)